MSSTRKLSQQHQKQLHKQNGFLSVSLADFSSLMKSPGDSQCLVSFSFESVGLESRTEFLCLVTCFLLDRKDVTRNNASGVMDQHEAKTGGMHKMKRIRQSLRIVAFLFSQQPTHLPCSKPHTRHSHHKTLEKSPSTAQCGGTCLSRLLQCTLQQNSGMQQNFGMNLILKDWNQLKSQNQSKSGQCLNFTSEQITKPNDHNNNQSAPCCHHGKPVWAFIEPWIHWPVTQAEKTTFAII